MYFTNPDGIRVPLESLAHLEYGFVSPMIRTDKRERMNVIYAEMGDESLVYPVIKLFRLFLSKDFMGDKYKLLSWNPYRINYL